MDTSEHGECPQCGRPITSKRNRCYACTSKKKTGKTCTCKVCGNEFYAAKWQLDDVARNSGVYCSRKCKHEGIKLTGAGSKQRRADGYIQTYYPKHPDASKSGWMMEHRLVAEQSIGRRIEKTEHVHHINGVKDDNRPENLEVISASAHAPISNAMGVAKRKAEREELKVLRAELAEYRKRYGLLKSEEDKNYGI